MNIASDVTALIGRTPLVRLNRLTAGLPRGTQVLAKLESFNPFSSVKDRIGLAMIEDAERVGGSSRERLCHHRADERQYRRRPRRQWPRPRATGSSSRCPRPSRSSVASSLRAYGAELVLTEGPKGMKGAIAKAEELAAAELPGSFIPMQFRQSGQSRDPSQDHRRGDLARHRGQGRHRRRRRRHRRDDHRRRRGAQEEKAGPQGRRRRAGRFPRHSRGRLPGPHKIQGIGAGFVPKVYNRAAVDEVIIVKRRGRGSDYPQPREGGGHPRAASPPARRSGRRSRSRSVRRARARRSS